MVIGIIGAGAVGQAFAKRALKVGHQVKLSNNRGPASLRDVVASLGRGAIAVSREEAAACEMVLLAAPWDNVPEALAGLPQWKNQILIDATNPKHGSHGNFTPANVGNLSTSQLVAGLAPGARVVKALNNLIVENFEADPVVSGLKRVVFVSADNAEAKKTVESLIESFGFRVIDLGNLRDGGLFQQTGGPLGGRDLYERGEYKT